MWLMPCVDSRSAHGFIPLRRLRLPVAAGSLTEAHLSPRRTGSYRPLTRPPVDNAPVPAIKSTPVHGAAALEALWLRAGTDLRDPVRAQVPLERPA